MGLNDECQATLNPPGLGVLYLMGMSIGARIRQLRQSNGLTQEKFGELCEVTKGMVSQWESDSTIPPTDRLLKLRQHLVFSIDELLLDNNPQLENKREDALLKLYRASDDRGRDTIFRVAEQESHYIVTPVSKTRNSA